MNGYYQSDKYVFNFTSSGLFTLVDKEGEPVYDRTLPLFEKLISHLVWVFFWLVIILTSHFFLPTGWIPKTDRLLMALVFFHLFMFGCRLTTLLIKGGLRPILFPPLWIRLTRKLQKKPTLELLKKYHLEDHPGLLSNLALIYYNRQEEEQALTTLKKALILDPENSILKAFYQALAAEEPTK